MFNLTNYDQRISLTCSVCSLKGSLLVLYPLDTHYKPCESLIIAFRISSPTLNCSIYLIFIFNRPYLINTDLALVVKRVEQILSNSNRKYRRKDLVYYLIILRLIDIIIK